MTQKNIIKVKDTPIHSSKVHVRQVFQATTASRESQVHQARGRPSD